MYMSNFSNAQAIPNASFPITNHLLSVSVSERDFDATNQRVPSGCTWKIVAPNPLFDASLMMIVFFFVLYQARDGD